MAPCRNLKDSIIINGSTVDQVNIPKFLDLTVMNTLSWTQNADLIIIDGRQGLLFFFLTLRSYNVDIDVMINFYCAVIEIILTTNILVWFWLTNKREMKKIESVIRTAERIIGTSLCAIQPIDHQNCWDNHRYLPLYYSTNRSSELLRESPVPPSVLFNQSIIRTAERIIGTSLCTIQPIDHQNCWENHRYLPLYYSTNRSSELLRESFVPPSVLFNQSIIRTAERIITTSLCTIQSIDHQNCWENHHYLPLYYSINRSSELLRESSVPPSVLSNLPLRVIYPSINQSIIRTAERIITTSLCTIQSIDHQNCWENHHYLPLYY